MASSPLSGDCERCVGLCCVAPCFRPSADFAVDKPAGAPCPNLGPEDRCTIHEGLREQGFPGCVAYDCFGAGQRVSQGAFQAQHWRDDPATARRMFAVFGVVRDLHELLWTVDEARRLEEASGAPTQALREAFSRLDALAEQAPEVLLKLEPGALRAELKPLVWGASERARAASRARSGGKGGDLSGSMHLGEDLRGRDLRGVALRGSCLVAADLRGADLRGADLLGADLRGASLHGADLREVCFCSPAQLASASGDQHTRLPPHLQAPAHWSRGHAAGT